MEVETEPQAVGVRSVARILECSPRHVERMDSKGMLPRPVRIGRAKRWALDELRRWLAAGAPDRVTWEAMKKTSV